MNNMSWFVAEIIGTFALIFMGVGAICTNEMLPGTVGMLGIAIAHGIAIAIMVSALAHISGGKFNPAISFGLFVGNRISAQRMSLEIVAQLVGAVLAAAAIWLIVPEIVTNAVKLGAPALSNGTTVWAGIIAEAIATFFLVLTVYGTAVDPRGSWRAVAGFAIGWSIVIGILAIGGLTGAALNPARAFGPALVSSNWADHFVYWAGPLTGGGLAGLLYGRWMIGENPQKVAVVEK